LVRQIVSTVEGLSRKSSLNSGDIWTQGSRRLAMATHFFPDVFELKQRQLLSATILTGLSRLLKSEV